MARPPITFEQVETVANWLVSQGVEDPGTRAVRDELIRRAGPGGTVGSPNTIQRHLNQWRVKVRPSASAGAPPLPPQLATEIARALQAAGDVAREKAAAHLAVVQAELDELAEVGEAAEARMEELQAQVAARTSERDSMAGQLVERTTEIAALKAALAAATQRTGLLEQQLSAARAEAQAAIGRVDEIRQASDRHIASLQAELDQARSARADAERQAVAADKQAVAAAAHLDGERAARQALQVQCEELRAAVDRLKGDAQRAAAAEAEAKGLKDQVALLTETVAMLREMLLAAGKPLPGASVADAAKPRGR